MGAEQVTIIGLLAMTALLIPVMISNKMLGLKINKSLVIGVIRMALQLAMVSVYLQFLFRKKHLVAKPYLCMYYALSADSQLRNLVIFAEIKFMILIFIGMAVPLLSVLLFMTSFVIRIDNMFDARYIVTISGMLMGNCMRGIIIGINSFYKI